MSTSFTLQQKRVNNNNNNNNNTTTTNNNNGSDSVPERLGRVGPGSQRSAGGQRCQTRDIALERYACATITNDQR
jgi:hypothetical protein